MKVAMITVFPDEPQHIVGGVAGVAKYLVDELALHPDVTVTVVVPQGTGGPATVREQWGGISVYRLARRGFWRHMPGVVYDVLAGRRQVEEFIRELEPDLVHYQGTGFLAAGSQRRKVLTIHGIAEKDALWDGRGVPVRWLRWLLMMLTEGRVRRRTPHVILISDYVRRMLPEDKERRIWRIDNPIADSFFNVDWAPESGRIFCCSRLIPRKNILGMIEAFARISPLVPRAQLRFAGSAEPRYLRACMDAVERGGLRSRVHFLGNLSVREVQAELSKANCFALPSFQETAPLSIAEAMAVGVPVVAAAVGGIPDMVERGRAGILVDPHDVRDIGDAIVGVISDDESARVIGRRGKESVGKRFRASVVAERTIAVYREILRARA